MEDQVQERMNKVPRNNLPITGLGPLLDIPRDVVQHQVKFCIEFFGRHRKKVYFDGVKALIKFISRDMATIKIVFENLNAFPNDLHFD